MPSAPPRPCTYPGCKAYAKPGGRCADHPHPPRWAQHQRQKGNRHERGYGYRWERIRRRILERDGYLCQACMAMGRYTKATDVDHILAKANGGEDDDSNLQSLCRQCHKAKTAKERMAGEGEK